MSIFDGHTLRGPRVAPGNSRTTASVTGGVYADCKPLHEGYSAEYKAFWGSDLVRPYVDQYRAAILEGRAGQLEEYLIFAANSSSLSVVEDPDYPISTGSIRIPSGDQQVATNDIESYTFPIAGAVETTAGSNQLVGHGTSFLNQLIVGASVYAGLNVYKVASVESHTEATLVEEAQSAFYGAGVVINPISDGTTRLILTDNGNRSLAGVVSIKIVLGDDDSKTKRTLSSADGHISMTDPESGLIQILDTDYTRSLFRPIDGNSPAMSRLRGDRVSEVKYYLASPRFWWTRNDPEMERFHWVGGKQRWEPIKGGSPINLGRLLPDKTYELRPRPTGLTVGGYLPGLVGEHSESYDKFAMVRLGSTPNANSTPVGDEEGGDFRGIEVVPDTVVDEGSFDFASRDPGPAAVIGETNGKLAWNPAFVLKYAGQPIWYSPRTLDKKSVGVVGRLDEADSEPLFIAPIPGFSDHVLLRIGSRRWLKVIYAASDSDLPAEDSIEEGSVAVSLTTGMLRFSPADVTKAVMGDVDSPNPDFQRLYVTDKVYFDGIVLNRVAQPARSPVHLGNIDVDGAEKWTLPEAVSGGHLGVSGVMHIEDKTGAIPVAGETVTTRPNDSGLLRNIKGVGDTFCFTPNHPLETLSIKDSNASMPEFPFSIRKGRAVASLSSTGNSKVMLGLRDRRRFDDKPLYFIQADFTPATYSEDARMANRKDGPYALKGSEVLRFFINDGDGDPNVFVEWDALTLTGGLSEEADDYTAVELADSITAAMVAAGSTGSCIEFNNRLVIKPHSFSSDSAAVEICYGESGVKNLSGCAALGFGPGWRTVGQVPEDLKWSAADPNWRTDSGHCFGLWRSPFNEDGSGAEADFSATARMEDEVLTEISPSPFVFLQQTPLVDIAGVDEGVFFEMQRGPYKRKLEHMDTIKHRFPHNQISFIGSAQFAWALESPASHLNLRHQSIITESLHPALNGYMRASFGGDPFRLLQPEEEFILPQDGMLGQAILIEEIGGLSHFGSKGSYEQGGNTLTDTDGDFIAAGIEVGDRLKLATGDAAGSYRITEVADTALQVEPVFSVSSGPAPISWEIYDMKTKDVVDSQVVADQVYKQFNHMPEESFKIRCMTFIGECPADDTSLTATVGDDLASGRLVNARVGLDYDPTGANRLEVVYLELKELGSIANGSIFVPAGSQRFLDGDFKLLLGKLELVPGENLSFIPDGDEFSEDPAVAEYGTTGEVKFSKSLLEQYDQVRVIYEEEPSTSLPAGQVEVHKLTGDVYFSAEDRSAYAGEPIFWVAQMITEDRKDVFCNPMAGAFMFKKPMLPGHIVEATYRKADMGGNLATDPATGAFLPEITQTLPLYVRKELCTRINAQQYSFNPNKKLVFDQVKPLAYFGAEQANWDYENAHIDLENGIISFYFEVDEGTNVYCSYAVVEAFGGESSYTVSEPPVYRPPFRLEGGVSQFELDTDRTDDLVVGAILRLGSALFYIKGVSYNPETDVTRVSIFPEVEGGAGSSAPGNDGSNLITAEPIALTVDPEEPVEADGPKGYLVPLQDFLDRDAHPSYEPLAKGMTDIVVMDNCTKLVAGHILEIGGYPLSIAGVQLSDDGRRTTITVVPSLPRSFAYGQDEIYVSMRPLYPPAPMTYIGAGGFMTDKHYEVVLWGERNEDGTEKPGRTLAEGVHYAVDPQTGGITLQQPLQSPLEATQKLYFARTRITVAKPELSKGALVFPRFGAKFKNLIAPSQENGLEGATLLGTYTFRSPDSFYCRAVPLEEYMGEVAIQMVKEANAKNPSFGASTGGYGGSKNHEQGRLGLTVEQSHLNDKDRAGRKFLSFYNSVVVAFEQITETITGSLVGDKDGKFRYWVGQGLEYTPPGWENPVTGELVPRNLWTEVFCESRGASSVYVDKGDWIVTPSTSYIDGDGDVDGDWVEGDFFDTLVRRQRKLIRNDLDDIVIVGRKRPKIIFKLSPLPHFIIKARGRFERLADPNEFSRIFPERASGFTTLYPGINAKPEEGNYGENLFLGIRDWKFRSTFGKTTGNISNPVLGEINNLTDCDTYPRTSRARIFRYEPEGFPELDAIIGSDFTNNPRPAIIATPGLLGDFPLDDKGRPDTAKLASYVDGGVPDLSTGDWEISTPGFGSGQRLQFGRPDGELFSAGHTGGSNDIFGSSRIKPVFVDTIYAGCVMTFKDGDDPILSGMLLVEMDSDEGGPILDLQPGDTVCQSLGGGVEKEINDPPTAEDMERIAAALPNYRRGFDYSVRMAKGEYKDITLPSFSDPTFFGLKELLGQKTPNPAMQVESIVEFRNHETEPLEIPALKGENTDDDGDWQIPYMGATNTEIQRLQAAQKAVTTIIMTDCDSLPAGTTQSWLAVYPDEIIGLDGSVSSSEDVLSAFMTLSDPTPTDGSYEPHSGLGDLRPYDLLLVEPRLEGWALPKGSQGILQISAVSDGGEGELSAIEQPRFVTPTTEGSKISYKLDNAAAYSAHDTGHLSGVWFEEQLYDDGTGNPNYPHRWTETRLHFDTVSPGLVVFDDGSESGSFDPATGDYPEGGLNTVLAKALEESYIDLRILRRSLDTENPVAGDGETFVIVRISVETAGTSDYITDVVGQPPGQPKFRVLLSLDNGVSWEKEYYVLQPAQDGGLWFEQDKIIIRTAHPLDDHTDPVDVDGDMPGDAGYTGPADPLYDEFAGSQWFPFALFDVVNDDSDGDPQFDEDGLLNPDWDGDLLKTETLNDDGVPIYHDFRLDFYLFSMTAWISEDRLTFNERFDFRLAKPRGAMHPIYEQTEGAMGDEDFETRLSVNYVAAAVWDVVGAAPQVYDSQVNGNVECNGGVPFTFLERPVDVGFTGVGGFDDGLGSMKVMSWEGHNNAPVDFDSAVFSALPSSEVYDESAGVFLCEGVGTLGRSYDDGGAFVTDETYTDRIKVYDADGLGTASFDPTQVEAGDIVVVTTTPLDLVPADKATASPKTGTYLVRHRVVPTDTTLYDPAYKPTEALVRALDLKAPTPSNLAWVRSYFPKITAVELEGGTPRFYIDNLVTWDATTDTASHGAWDTAGGDLYIHRSTPKPDDDPAAFAERVFKTEYDALEVETTVGHAHEGEHYFEVDLGTFLNGVGDDLTALPTYQTDELIIAALQAEVGKRLYGFHRLPVSVIGSGLPASGATGHTEHTDFGASADISLYGISALSIKSPVYNLGSVIDWAGGGADPIGYAEWSFADGTLFDEAGGAGIKIYERSIPDHPGAFTETEPDVVHRGAPGMLDLSEVTDAQWGTLTQTQALTDAGLSTVVFALMPSCEIHTSRFVTGLNVDLPAFYADAGIFLEPSFPRPTMDLGNAGGADGDGLVMAPRVSCGPSETGLAQIDLADDAVGSRQALDFVATFAGANPLFDRVEINVRRVRRWKKMLDDFSKNLQALRFVYEIRKGIVGSYSMTGTFGNFTADTSDSAATNLGAFDNRDVNINAGDMLRILHPVTGEVIAFGEIISVDDAASLTLRPPGLQGSPPEDYPDWAGLPFEVFLRRAPVPQKQSNEELLDLMTNKVIFRRTAEWNPAEKDNPSYPDNGGFVLWDTGETGTWEEYQESFEDPADADYDEWKALVYETSINRFTDTNAGSAEGQINFLSEGIEVGDILIIDPAGALQPLNHPTGTEQEFGTRPYGDIGTPSRSGEAAIASGSAPAGRPAELDDNRGYYVVTGVKAAELTVAPFEDSEYIGQDGENNALFGFGSPEEIALYPTISGSALGRDGKEGQGDLRPTAWAGTNPLAADGVGDVLPGSFKNCTLSIAPVSWIVIRPSDFFSEQSQELILMHRERIQSLVENLEEAMVGNKSGAYRIFREDRHIFDLGHPNIPAEGLGMPSNRFLYDCAGITKASPFLNDSDCLSILDRRVHCQDLTLDSTKPPYSDYSDPAIAFYTKLGLGVLRPLVPDRIEEALNSSDRFRGLRYAWLNFRAHRINGTLAEIDRFKRELPKRIREMERMRRMSEGAGGR